MHQAQIVLKSFEARCKFSKKPMYNCEVYPSDCGENTDGSHIFFNDDDLVEKGGSDSQAKKDIATEWLQQLGWSMVTNRENKRFICPLHQQPGMPM